MYKRVISAILSAALVISAAYASGAADAVEKGGRVRIIVETEGAPLLETKNAVRLGAAEFMKTAEAEETGLRLMRLQDEVKADIEKTVGEDADAGFTYTSVINGFSMEAYESDIEKIKSIDGVKNVYIAPAFKIPDEPETAETLAVKGEPSVGAQMLNAQAMYDAGYDGRGQAVAVLDTDIDTAHEFFATPVEEPRLSKEDIRNFLENNELNVDVEVDQVYRNSKIPFAYDYAERDADTYNPNNEHGTHVAGVLAGKNGVYGEMTFSGIAPEVQLIVMKIFDEDGTFSFDTAMAAMDDAAKMDICAVNMSIGAIYAEVPLCEEAVNNLKNAGIAVIGSAGNSDRSVESAENPDYSYYDLPTNYSASTSVASIDAVKEWSLGGKITLGNGEELIISAYNKTFFGKFSDKFYEYVYITPDYQPESVDVKGKIAVILKSGSNLVRGLLNRGAVGIIAISDNENDGEVVTPSGEILGVIVRKSYGEKLINSEIKTLKTDAEQNFVSKDVPNAGMSDFTSWGTGAPLELKPEITAPGGNILSSMHNDKYESKSGTSMATPQITGAIALMNGFVSDKYPGVTGPDKVSLMENLLMSSARIIFQDSEKTLPESPRRQGAGLADLKAAMNLPVILKGDGGKSKLSLKDMLTDEISLKFTAKNLTDSDVTYDDIKLYVLTDDYKEEEGENMIAGSTALRFTSDAPESVTVPAGGEKEITVSVKLDGEQTAKNKEIFTNGFWVDGFVVLGSKDGSVTKASMPFTGFYGDWTALDAMTPSYFEEGGSLENGGLALRDPDNDEYTLLGTNKFLEDTDDKSGYESEDYVGISEYNSGNYYLRIRMLRSLANVTLTIKDSNGEIINENEWENGLTRQNKEKNYYEAVELLGADLPEGDYSVTVKGRFAFDSDRSRVEEKTLKFYMDSAAPEIKNPRIYEENGKRYASFEASDNRYLMGAEAWDVNNGYACAPVKAEKNAKIVIDITDLDEESVEFAVFDYAYNEYDFKIGSVSAEISKKVKEGDNAAFIANITNTGEDIDADVIIALYSGEGELVGAKKQNVLIESGEKKTLAFNLNGAANAVKAKLFVWRHGEMTPVTKPFVMTEL